MNWVWCYAKKFCICVNCRLVRYLKCGEDKYYSIVYAFKKSFPNEIFNNYLMGHLVVQTVVDIMLKHSFSQFHFIFLVYFIEWENKSKI